MSLAQPSFAPPVCAADAPLRGIRSNIVQSIRAFRVPDLQDAAVALGHHFLYANLAAAQSKQDVLDLISQQFIMNISVGKNFDSLYDSLTDPVHKSGPQTGFIAVLEHIPANAKFDKEAREQLLDIFRDTVDYWGDRKVPFRCFYSFSVARSAHAVSLADAAHPSAASTPSNIELLNENGERMLTDKLLDISPQALRMSSPFNAGYWTAT
jgi:RNAse (barnase) inhibitor barstar